MNDRIKFREYWELINKSIFTNDRKEKNLRAVAYMGGIIALFGMIMSIMNFIQHKDFALYTTIIVFICGCLILVSSVALKNRILSIIIILFLCVVLFSVYAITGMNDGFAILWTMIVPMAFSYIASVRSGILLSIYYELLFIVLFYTPIRDILAEHYTSTFMNRYPILYLCNIFFIIITMVQYHISVIHDIEYQQRLNEEVKEQTHIATERAEKLEKISNEIMMALSKAVDAKDHYTNGHSQRVAAYSKEIARRLGKNEEECNNIYAMGLLHDVGKIGISEDIINKTTRLSYEEFLLIKNHTEVGYNILKTITEMPFLAIGAKWHHEKFDGSGYPDGLIGKQIPIEARIICIADCYDAMTSQRSYSSPKPQNEVREELFRCRGKQFDPIITDIMIEMIDEDKEYKMCDCGDKQPT